MLNLNHTTTTVLALIAGALILGVMLAGSVLARRARQNKQAARFKQRWQDAQKLCAKAETWPMAIIEADKLVDDALKANGFKGRSMGERLVSAQRQLTDNDGVWFGHKLRNKIVHEEMPKLAKRDVQNALMGLRQALQDLGVL